MKRATHDPASGYSNGKLGGLGAILTGIGGLITLAVTFDANNIQEQIQQAVVCLGLITGGLAAFGIRARMDR